MNISYNGSIFCDNSTRIQEDIPFTNIIVFIEATTGVLVVIGNVFIMVLIQRKKLLGRSTNVFVFSIAVADCLNGIISIPTHIASLIYIDTSSVYLCKCYRFAAYLSKTVVPYTILFMTGEKVMRILCPTKDIITVARCMFFTSLLWFFASAFNIWCVVLFTTEPVDLLRETAFQGEPNCAQQLHFSKSNKCILNGRFKHLHDVFLVLDLFILFILPISSVLVLYLVLLFKYFSVLRERILTYFYVIKLVIALFTNVCLTHLPLEVITVLDNTTFSDSMVWYFVSNLASSLYFTRGVWNLIIYSYFKRYVCRKRSLTSIRAGNVNGALDAGHRNRFQLNRNIIY